MQTNFSQPIRQNSTVRRKLVRSVKENRFEKVSDKTNNKNVFIWKVKTGAQPTIRNKLCYWLRVFKFSRSLQILSKHTKLNVDILNIFRKLHNKEKLYN